jgi:hypothetical protein
LYYELSAGGMKSRIEAEQSTLQRSVARRFQVYLRDHAASRTRCIPGTQGLPAFARSSESFIVQSNRAGVGQTRRTGLARGN